MLERDGPAKPKCPISTEKHLRMLLLRNAGHERREMKRLLNVPFFQGYGCANNS